MTLDAQWTLDYADSAQKQIAALTLSIEERTTIEVTTSGVADLPANVLQVEALYVGTERLPRITTDDMLGFLTGGTGAWVGESSFVIVGRELHVLPVPSETVELTMIARVRPADMTIGDQFQLTGEQKDLTQRLVGAMILLDDGEPEVAVEQLQIVLQDAQRLRVAQTRRSGGPKRIRTARWDRI